MTDKREPPLLQLKNVWRTYPAGEHPIHALKAIGDGSFPVPVSLLPLVGGLAGLGFAVAWDKKGGFIGKEALAAVPFHFIA